MTKCVVKRMLADFIEFSIGFITVEIIDTFLINSVYCLSPVKDIATNKYLSVLLLLSSVDSIYKSPIYFMDTMVISTPTKTATPHR